MYLRLKITGNISWINFWVYTSGGITVILNKYELVSELFLNLKTFWLKFIATGHFYIFIEIGNAGIGDLIFTGAKNVKIILNIDYLIL